MPELPEVETVVRGLRPFFEGQRLEALEVLDPKVDFESDLPLSALVGQAVRKLGRRGKYIYWDLGGAHLVQHLRMTGKMLPAESPALPLHYLYEPAKLRQLRARLRVAGKDFYFYDTRRFGTLTAVADIAAFWERKGQAPDPLDLSERAEARRLFLERVGRGQRAVKAALLDQNVMSGCGNIYADEALHQCGIHPLLRAEKLKEPQKRALFAALLKIFERSVEQKGTTSSDYLGVNGEPGDFARYLKVYSRTGESCRGCKKSVIKRIVVVGRSTHFCPSCQRK